MDRATEGEEGKEKRHWTHYSREVYAQVYALADAGCTKRDISRQMHIPFETVRSILKRRPPPGEPIPPKHRGGSKPSKITPEVEAKIVEILREQPILTNAQVV